MFIIAHDQVIINLHLPLYATIFMVGVLWMIGTLIYIIVAGDSPDTNMGKVLFIVFGGPLIWGSIIFTGAVEMPKLIKKAYKNLLVCYRKKRYPFQDYK